VRAASNIFVRSCAERGEASPQSNYAETSLSRFRTRAHKNFLFPSNFMHTHFLMVSACSASFPTLRRSLYRRIVYQPRFAHATRISSLQLHLSTTDRIFSSGELHVGNYPQIKADSTTYQVFQFAGHKRRCNAHAFGQLLFSSTVSRLFISNERITEHVDQRSASDGDRCAPGARDPPQDACFARCQHCSERAY
jgi:hypothetical protein